MTDDELVVSVVDDGRGFDARRAGRRRPSRDSPPRRERSAERCRSSRWPAGARTCARTCGCRPSSAVGVDESASALVRTLGDREFEVLRLLAVGHRNREIAAELALSLHTVKFHVAKILEKLGVRTRAEAAAVAFAAGIHPRPQPAAVAADG